MHRPRIQAKPRTPDGKLGGDEGLQNDQHATNTDQHRHDGVKSRRWQPEQQQRTEDAAQE